MLHWYYDNGEWPDYNTAIFISCFQNNMLSTVWYVQFHHFWNLHICDLTNVYILWINDLGTLQICLVVSFGGRWTRLPNIRYTWKMHPTTYEHEWAPKYCSEHNRMGNWDKQKSNNQTTEMFVEGLA